MNAPEPDNEFEDVDFDDLLEDDDESADVTDGIEGTNASDFADDSENADADAAPASREYSHEKARAAKRKIAAPDETERLQKLIARAGVASRRAAEEMIFAGRVTVNDEVVREAGFKASRRDRIAVDGRVLRFPTGAATVVLLHKPVHVVTTKSDPQKRTTVTDFLPPKLSHLHPIGRLDFDTTGLLLLTDDGELTQLLTHPSHGIEKVYLARVRGTVALATVKNLEAGVFLDDGKTAPCRVRVRAQTEKNALLQITLREGKNRQVRRMLEHVGHPASALRRVRVGNIEIEDIPAGAYRVLLGAEVHELKKLATRGPKKAPQRKTSSRAKSAESPRTPRASTRDTSSSPRGESTKPRTAASHPEKFAPRKSEPNRNSESRTSQSSRGTSSERDMPRTGPTRPSATRSANGRDTESRFSNSPRNMAQRGESRRSEEARAGQFSRGEASQETPSRNATPRRSAPSSQTRGENTREYSQRGDDTRRDASREEEGRPHPLANRIERSFDRGSQDTAARQRREFAQKNAAREAGRQAAPNAAASTRGNVPKTGDGAALRASKPRGSGALHDSKQPRTDRKPRGGGKNSRKTPPE